MLWFSMEIFAENLEAAACIDEKVIDEVDGQKPFDTRSPPAPLIQAPLLSSSKSSTSSCPVEFHSPPGAPILPALSTPAHNPVAKMSLALAEPVSMSFFSSSPVVSSCAPSSVPSDSPRIFPSSPAMVVDLFVQQTVNPLASSFALRETSATLSPSFASPPPSVSLAIPTTAFPPSSVASARSSAPLADSGSASLGCSTAPVDSSQLVLSQQDIPSVADAGLPTSAEATTAHSSRLPLEGSPPSTEAAARVTGMSSFSTAISVPENSVMPSMSAVTIDPSTVMSSILRMSPALPVTARNQLSTASQASHTIAMPSDLSVPLEAKLSIRRSSETFTVPNVPETHSSTLLVTPAGLSIGLPSEPAPPSLAISTSQPASGNGEAMDCSQFPSSHLLNDSSNSASVSDLLPEVRSPKEELAAKSCPPIVPSSEYSPRRPIKGGQRGEGWPYAPQGWPDRDDKWSWRVGKRLHANGYFRDRSLGLPKSLCKGRKITEFASKKSIGEYLKQIFPSLSIESFFKSFQWRVPYVNYRNPSSAARASKVKNTFKRRRPSEEGNDQQNSAKRPRTECGAGNPKCGLETGRSTLLEPGVGLVCDICCTEPGFCRECKCILCCKTIIPESGDCNLIRCLQRPPDGGICGHAAHLECALRTKMAGVVKKRGLDMEYLCRRCDRKTDLRELVTLLLETLGNTELRTQAEKSLELALEIMKGTDHGGSGARVLESLVQSALRKVQSGVDIQEVFNDLKEQGSAAEAAKQQNLTRGVSSPEDISQQPEASLDQWLPSSGSPSSHPSPGTPSSFTSPLMRCNPSVTSGPPNGTQYVDGAVGKHTVAEGNADHFGEAQTPEFSNNFKISYLASRPPIRNGGQALTNPRIQAVSSNANNVHEAICDSHTARITGNQTAEPDLRDGNSSQGVDPNSNSGTKNPDHRRSFTADEGVYTENTLFTEICRSCGTLRHHTSDGFEVTSSRRSPKTEDGRKKGLQNISTPKDRDQGDSENDKCIQEKDMGVNQTGGPSVTFCANSSGLTVMGTSLDLLASECEQNVQVALQKLRKSQDAEFERMKQYLAAQKETTVRQYELLESARSKFSELPFGSLEAFDELMQETAVQFAKATDERKKFKAMLKAGEGFGSFSTEDLRRLYGWPVER